MPFTPGRPYLSRKPVFHPDQLGPAIFLDASASDSLNTSNAGTGAISDTATVGYWRDLSRNGFDISSVADDTTRPTWNINAGLPYVNFDGTNDYLRRAASLGMWAAGECSAFAAVRGNPGTVRYLLSETSSSSTQPVYTLMQSEATATTESCFFRTSVGTVLNNLPDVTSAWDNTDRVIGVVDSGANVDGYRDGAIIASSPYARGAGSMAVDLFSLGALNQNGTISIWFAARVYALVVVRRALKTGEIRELTRWLGGKMGLAI